MQRHTEKILVSQHFSHFQDSQTVILILLLSLCPLKIQVDAVQFIFSQYLLYIFCKCCPGSLIRYHCFPFATGSTQTYFRFRPLHIGTDRLYQFLPGRHSFFLKNTGILKRKRTVFMGTDIQKDQVIACPQTFSSNTTTVIKITPYIGADKIVLLRIQR